MFVLFLAMCTHEFAGGFAPCPTHCGIRAAGAASMSNVAGHCGWEKQQTGQTLELELLSLTLHWPERSQTNFTPNGRGNTGLHVPRGESLCIENRPNDYPRGGKKWGHPCGSVD